MRKIVRLTESDLVRLVNKTIKEQARATGWKEEGEGGNIPVMTMQQFFNDPNWGGSRDLTPGDYWKIISDFSGSVMVFGKDGKKVKVKL